jgi:hypothetical protein
MAYANCRFCGGRGCLACEGERQKDVQKEPQPIFVASRDDPKDLEALGRVIGREAIDKAFGPDGGGIKEIEFNAAVESFKQAARKDREAAWEKVEQEFFDGYDGTIYSDYDDGRAQMDLTAMNRGRAWLIEFSRGCIVTGDESVRNRAVEAGGKSNYICGE